MTHRSSEFASVLKLTLALGCAFSVIAAAGCDFAANVDISTSPVSGGSSTAYGAFTLGTINTNAPSAFTLSVAGDPMYNTRTFAFTGTCNRGASGMQLSSDGVALTPTYTCASDGTISIPSVTLPASGSADHVYSVGFTPLGADGSAITASTVTQKIFVKTSGPPAPVITTVPASSSTSTPFSVAVGLGTSNVSGTIVVNGTTSLTASDYVASLSEITYGLGTLSSSISGGTFSDTFTITQGHSISLSFRATDILGNLGSVTNIVVTTSSVMGSYGFTVGGLITTKVTGITPFTDYMSAFAGGPVVTSMGSGVAANATHTAYFGVPLDDNQGP